MNLIVFVKFLNAFDFTTLSHRFKHLFVIASPLVQRKFSNINHIILINADSTLGLELVLTYLCNLTCKTTVPRFYFLQFLAMQFALYLSDHIDWIELRDVAGPSCANAICTVHQNHRDHWHIVRWFDGQTFITLVIHDCHIIFRKDQARLLVEIGEYVSA